MAEAESLESLQTRHRKEQRDLVARVTQKKKSATKKTRKGVNDECDRLEQELKERQARERSALSRETTEAQNGVEEEADAHDDEPLQVNGVELTVDSLSLSPALNGTSPSEPEPDRSGPRKKPNRAKARLARRAADQEALAAQAAEEAANLPDQREHERLQMKELFEKHGLQEKEIRADGHCLYAAMADQMETTGLGLQPRIQPTINGDAAHALPPYKTVRHAAADFISQHSDDFVPFMEEPLDAYLQKIRETGEWGGHMELMALAKTYRIKINVLHADGRVDKIEPEEGSSPGDEKAVWLGYYKHNFGLGEHYNSLRKTP